MNYLYVGIGGFIGSILRVSIGSFLMHKIPSTIFPFSTLTINLLGAFILAYFLTNFSTKLNQEFKLFFSTGILGSFTTFSAFSLETIYLINSYEFLLAFSYISFSLLGGIIFALLGFKVAKIKLSIIAVSSESRSDKF